MNPSIIIKAFKEEFINILKSKYLFTSNSESNRNKLIQDITVIFNEYVQLINVPDSIKEIKFVDKTTQEDAINGHMLIMIKAGNKIISVTEFFEKLEKYLNKK